MEDLLDKLKALGLKVEKAVDLESPAVEKTAPIDQVVQGRWLNELTHGVFVIEKDIPLGSKYGQITLFPPENMDYLKEFAGIQSNLAVEKMLFIDTETSSLSTGAGSFVFMVGISFFSGENLRIIQLFMAKPEFEIELLCYFDDILKDFDTFVSYNGKAFDIPMLRSRYIINRLPVSFTDYQHLDLLHIARRIWKLRLDSRRLADIEKEILALTRSEEEIPGWLVPQIYFDTWIRTMLRRSRVFSITTRWMSPLWLRYSFMLMTFCRRTMPMCKVMHGMRMRSAVFSKRWVNGSYPGIFSSPAWIRGCRMN
jgi:uncharacterized protein YprB with RNaseH-like and TPR domain